MSVFADKKVVVTGGAGFIGSHLVDALIERGANVYIIDNLSGGKKENVNKKAVFHNKDIRDMDAVRDIISGAVYVFHCAALPRVQYSIEHPIETSEVNITGTLNLLITSQEAKVKKFVYSASSSAYGDQPVLPLTEDMEAHPKSPYGLQKYIGELLCKQWSEIYNLSTVSLRYFNVYGPRQNEDGAYALVIGKFLKQKREGEPMTITGDGMQTRDFTHVSDVIEANLLAAESDRASNGEVFNIGFGENVSINDIAHLIGGPVEHIPARLEPHDTRADNSRAKEVLGWKPRVSIKEGISALVEKM